MLSSELPLRSEARPVLLRLPFLLPSHVDSSTGRQPSPSMGCAETSQFRAVNVRKPNDGGSCTNWLHTWKRQAGSLLSRRFELAFPLSVLKF